jgi:hypothetical protein
MAEALVETAGGLLAAEVEEHLGGGGEEDGVASLDGGVGDVLGDHRLPEALVRDEHDVVGLFQEVEAERCLDGVAVDGLGPGPVEVGNRLEATEPAAPEASLEALASPVLFTTAAQMLLDLGRIC